MAMVAAVVGVVQPAERPPDSRTSAKLSPLIVSSAKTHRTVADSNRFITYCPAIYCGAAGDFEGGAGQQRASVQAIRTEVSF